MDAAPARPRHLAHRARIQPARRWVARCLRSAAILVACGCGEKAEVAAPRAADAPRQDYLARFLEGNWTDVGAWEPRDLVEDLQRYIAGDYPLYRTKDKPCVRLYWFLFKEAPDPRPFLPLFGPHDEIEVTDALLRRDVIASTVVTSFMRRAARPRPAVAPPPPDETEPVSPTDWKPERFHEHLYDVIMQAGIYFAFDPAYGEAHTETSVDLGDFFGDWRVSPTKESEAAMAKHLDAYLAQWRRRVTNKGSSTFFGLVLRHLRRAGAEALAGEWGRMSTDERYDLLKRLAEEEELGARARRLLVDALQEESFELKEAAVEALAEQGAPMGELDAGSREEDFERALPGLRSWAAKTKP